MGSKLLATPPHTLRTNIHHIQFTCTCILTQFFLRDLSTIDKHSEDPERFVNIYPTAFHSGKRLNGPIHRPIISKYAQIPAELVKNLATPAQVPTKSAQNLGRPAELQANRGCAAKQGRGVRNGTVKGLVEEGGRSY